MLDQLCEVSWKAIPDFLLAGVLGTGGVCGAARRVCGALDRCVAGCDVCRLLGAVVCRCVPLCAVRWVPLCAVVCRCVPLGVVLLDNCNGKLLY